MVLFKLNKETKKSVYASTGMDVDFIAKADINTIDTNIEARIHKKLSFSTFIGGLLPRGSVYLMFKRFITGKEVERKLSKIVS